MTIRIITGDCREVLKTLPDASVDSIVTDPPYELGFMGKGWDSTGIANDPAMWAACLRVLKPGGHLLAFSGTRTYHRMVCAIEDAGFEIRDQIGWAYGSGFPKSLDVSKAIDKAAGAEREVIAAGKPVKRMIPGADQNATGSWIKDNGREFVPTVTEPATDSARQWQGWGTALKPAWEPICVARKPLDTCATNVLQIVESQLRERGVRGEILWKPENASGVARSKKTTSSGSTRPSERSATSAKTADESVTQSAEQQSLKSSEQLGTSGLKQTQGASESFQGCTTSGCGNQSSAPMEGSAHAAESVSATSSPSTTSTAAEPSTASKFTGRCTPNCAETVSRPDTESFAGIATGLTGSMETVRISRDSEGFFLWPKGLPEFVPGSPLTVAANVLTHGTGALNIDGCRVPTDDKLGGGGEKAETSAKFTNDGWKRPWMDDPDALEAQAAKVRANVKKAEALGRWPANLIHDGSDEVLAAFPNAPGQIADESRTAPSEKTSNVYGRMNRVGEPSADSDNEGVVGFKMKPGARRLDTGSAARFFYCAKADKADRGEGNAHPTVKPGDLMRYLCRLVTPAGGTVLDPFAGSGSTLLAADREGFDAIGIELDPQYAEMARRRIHGDAPLFAEVDGA